MEHRLQLEIDIMRKVAVHPNIVALYDVFITPTKLKLVLEMCPGGELFDQVIDCM